VINPLTHRRVLKRGVPGRATVTRMSPLPPRAQHSARVNLAMTLEVELEGSGAYRVEGQWLCKPADAAGLTAGPFPVKVDRSDPQKVAIDWDGVRATAGRPGIAP